jgi:hypothetical protein
MTYYPINPSTVVDGASNDFIEIQQGGLDARSIKLQREDVQTLRDVLGAWLCAGQPPQPNEDKVAVMLGDTADGRPPIVILGMSQAAWDYCKDGKTHTFDLTGAGVPLQLMIAGGQNREQIIEDVARGVAVSGGEFERRTLEVESRDLGMKPPVTN